MHRRRVIGIVTALVAVVLMAAPPPAAAASWRAVSYREVMKDARSHFVRLPIAATVLKDGLNRKLTVNNDTGRGYTVAFWRRQEGKPAVKIGSKYLPPGASRGMTWKTGRCRGEVAAAVTYLNGYKYDTSWPKPMFSAAKRC